MSTSVGVTIKIDATAFDAHKFAEIDPEALEMPRGRAEAIRRVAGGALGVILVVATVSYLLDVVVAFLLPALASMLMLMGLRLIAS